MQQGSKSAPELRGSGSASPNSTSFHRPLGDSSRDSFRELLALEENSASGRLLDVTDNPLTEGTLMVAVLVLLIATIVSLSTPGLEEIVSVLSFCIQSLFLIEFIVKLLILSRDYLVVFDNCVDSFFIIVAFALNASTLMIVKSPVLFGLLQTSNIFVVLGRWNRIMYFRDFIFAGRDDKDDDEDVQTHLERAVKILRKMKIKSTTRPYEIKEIEWIIRVMKSNELHHTTGGRANDEAVRTWLAEYSKNSSLQDNEDSSRGCNSVLTRAGSMRKRANTALEIPKARRSTKFVQNGNGGRKQSIPRIRASTLELFNKHSTREIGPEAVREPLKTKKLVLKSKSFSGSHSSFVLNVYDEYIGEHGKILERYLDDMSTLHFDPFEFMKRSKSRPLVGMFQLIICRKHLADSLQLDISKLKAFLNVIQDGYVDSNPYHTALHAADVLQGMYAFTECESMSDVISDLDRFNCYVAAAVHDFRHPGRNNKFLAETMNSLAVAYNDIAILENYHLAECFEVIRKTECNIFSEFSVSDRRYSRQMIIDMVLATDMSCHFNDLSLFKTLDPGSLSLEEQREPEMKRKICKFALHASDISNPCRPLHVYSQWAELCMEEFFLQGDEERSRGMDISMFYDRNHQNKPKCQLGFIDFIVKPMFTAWVSFLIEMHDVCLGHLEQNREYWDREQDKLKAIELDKEIDPCVENVNEVIVEFEEISDEQDSV